MVYNYLYNPVKSLPYSATAKKNPGAHFKGRPGLLLSSGTKRNEALRLFHFMAPDREDFFSDVRVIVSSGKPFGLRAKTKYRHVLCSVSAGRELMTPLNTACWRRGQSSGLTICRDHDQSTSFPPTLIP